MRKIDLVPRAVSALFLFLFAVGMPGCSTDSASRENRSEPGWSTTSEPDPVRWEKTPTLSERLRREDGDGASVPARLR